MAGFTLRELAERVGAQIVGNADRRVGDVRPLGVAGPDDLSFLHNPRYLAAAQASVAGALIVTDPSPFAGRDLLVCAEPYVALARILELFHPRSATVPGVHPTAVVAASARVAEGAAVGPCAVIGDGVEVASGAVIGAGCVLGIGVVVGEGTELRPRVVVEDRCRIGSRCLVHAGTVIGSDGFGFATSGGVHHKVPQVGVVVIEDDVELGANVCIDRATFGETRVGRGTKVDNLVQIAHNVTVGEHSLLVAQSGISGSTTLGHHVVMAGQSGAVGHLAIAERTVVTAKTGVTEDTSPGQMVSGFPSRPHREWLRAMGNLFQLEGLRRRVRALEDAVRRLGGGQ